MRRVVERSQFLKSLNHVQSVVERRNTIPILSNILLQAKGGKIRLTATDLDVEVVETLGGDIAREGATTVPAHMLHDIVRKLPDGTQIEIVQGPDDKRHVDRSRSHPVGHARRHALGDGPIARHRGPRRAVRRIGQAP